MTGFYMKYNTGLKLVNALPRSDNNTPSCKKKKYVEICIYTNQKLKLSAFSITFNLRKNTKTLLNYELIILNILTVQILTFIA